MALNEHDGPESDRIEKAKKQLQDAIEEYMAANYDGEPVMVTGWILQSCGQALSTAEDGKFPLIYAGMSNMSMVIAQGLKEILVYNIDALTYGDDDD